MQLEFHQLDRRWEHLRVREPHRQRRLLASLADCGQQTPIVVVVCQDNRERYLVIDGHKRVAALEQLGRDTVAATVWEMSEAEALVLSRSLRLSPQESALEQGWLLSEMEQRFGYSLEELGRRFDRSVSWVSRRLALVELLPETIQQQVREGRLGAQLAMKYLVPVARVSVQDCERMAAAWVQHRCDTRQAGQLYAAWREGSRVVRERILAAPELFLKTQRQPPAIKPAAEESSVIWKWRLPSYIVPTGDSVLNVTLDIGSLSPFPAVWAVVTFIPPVKEESKRNLQRFRVTQAKLTSGGTRRFGSIYGSAHSRRDEKGFSIVHEEAIGQYQWRKGTRAPALALRRSAAAGRGARPGSPSARGRG